MYRRFQNRRTVRAEFAVSVSNKLNNVVDWGQDEMESAIVALEIPFSDIHSYFFTHLVEKSSTE